MCHTFEMGHSFDIQIQNVNRHVLLMLCWRGEHRNESCIQTESTLACVPPPNIATYNKLFTLAFVEATTLLDNVVHSSWRQFNCRANKYVMRRERMPKWILARNILSSVCLNMHTVGMLVHVCRDLHPPLLSTNFWFTKNNKPCWCMSTTEDTEDKT